MAKHKILVSDPISEVGIELLKQHPDLDVDVKIGISPEDLLKVISDYEGLVVRSQTKVGRDVFDASNGSLKAVGRAGVGVDNIDREAATDHGVVVMNTPTGNTISTAEHAFSLLTALARNIPQAHASIVAGKWERKAFQGVELNQKRLAVLGMGRIGSEFAKRAQAFGMTVVAYDPFLSASRASSLKVELAESVDQALTGADVVTLHMPLNDETKHLVDAKRLALMNPGALVINCARGGLVDEAALSAAIESGHVAGAGLDVYEVEPPNISDPLFGHPKVVFTPHLGASTAEAQENVGIQVAEQILSFFVEGSITNAVNMPSLDGKTLEELGPILDMAKALGRSLAKLAPSQADALRVNFYGSIADLDTALITRMVLVGYLENARQESQVNLVNATAFAKQMGLRVTESSMAEDADFTELLQVEVVKGEDRYSASGTFFGNTPRIVEINGHRVEASTTGQLLVVENDDTPGIVGLVGTLLGTESLNIANMSLSREAQGGRALTLIELDSQPSASLLEALAKNPSIHQATPVSL